MQAFLRQAWVGVRVLLVMTIVLGIAYPVAIFAVGRLTPFASDGPFVTDTSGEVVGSRLIGQSFTDPQWFWSRPSAAGDGYDALSSSGSNLGPNNPDLVSAIAERKAAVASAHAVRLELVPADAVTASGSGLDPDISPEYARLQVARVASARGLREADVAALVDSATQGRILGFIGEPRVNVLELNLALKRLG